MAGAPRPHRPHRCKHCGVHLRSEEAASARAASSHFDRTPSFPPARGDGGDEPEHGRPPDLSPHGPLPSLPGRLTVLNALLGDHLEASAAGLLGRPRPLCDCLSQKECTALAPCMQLMGGVGHIRCQRRSRAADGPGAEGGGRGQRICGGLWLPRLVVSSLSLRVAGADVVWGGAL